MKTETEVLIVSGAAMGTGFARNLSLQGIQPFWSRKESSPQALPEEIMGYSTA